MPNLSASFMFSGMGDYWSGHGGRGERGGCAFAYYGKDTTLADLVDQWVEDSWCNDCDFAGIPESVSSDDIREAILESFTDAGRADYESGAICEFAEEYASVNDLNCCKECKAYLGEAHEDGCSLSVDLEDNEGETSAVVEEDLPEDDDCMEYPIAIMWIDWSDHPDYVEM